MTSSRFQRSSISQGRQAIILHPGDLAAVMSATPLLAALANAYPDVAFDWLVSDAARPVINGNPRLRRLISAGRGSSGSSGTDKKHGTREDLAARLKATSYDMAFIPEPSRELALRARRAGIGQRFGFRGLGDALLLTTRGRRPAGDHLPAQRYLALAAAAGVPPELVQAAEMEFYPSDYDRADVTRWLVESLDWLGDTLLVVVHPGIGVMDETMRVRQWPAERFARLANHLTRQYGARVVLVGGPNDVGVAREVAGMVSVPVANRTGQMGLGEMGALCELANLYIGNNVGAAYVAAASGCPTVVTHGPTDPARSSPYMLNTPVTNVWRSGAGPFSWSSGVTVAEVVAAAATLLVPRP